MTHDVDGDVLRIEGLEVRVGAAGPQILHGVSLRVPRGACVALVGESGSGKSVTAMAALGRLPGTLRRTGGQVALAGQDPARLAPGALRRLLARGTGFVPQDPLAAMDPLFGVGDQIASPRDPRGAARLVEALGALLGGHRPGRRARLAEAARLLGQVGLRDAAARAGDFPHQFSGGMRQRALIAAATRHAPALVVADEPTTALDAALERQVLTLLREAARASGSGLLLISHDLNLVSWFADHAYVMRAGHVVEDGPVEELFRRPREGYTRALLAAAPALRVAAAPAFRRRAPARPDPPLLAIADVSIAYGQGAGRVGALDGVDLTVAAGEFLAVVGESGSGKSTMGRIMMALERPGSGRVALDGVDLWALPAHELRRLRASFQPVFQDPLSSLDPRWRVGRSVVQPLAVHGARGWPDLPTAEARLLDRVGLPGLGARFPHELSGGQRQRIAIARAFAPRPRLIVADEAVSALDVTTQASILDMFTGFCREDGGAVVFITHDLRLVQAHADRVVVMHRGRIVEEGAPARVMADPGHAYTRELIAGLLPPRFPPASNPAHQEA